MDDEETLLRRARLRQLIDVCFESKDVLLLDFIEKKTGKRPNQGELSSLKKDNGGKSFGDKKARALAGQIGLCRHWFTMPLGANTSPEHWQSEIPTEWSKDPAPTNPNLMLLTLYIQKPSRQAEVHEPEREAYPDTIMVTGEEKLIVLGYRKLSEGMRQIWLQAAKDAVEKEAETTVDRKKHA